ncbi:MAG: AAA family ATPase [Clostridia bacterium]|nr:AAA family ATPase [Clostridia bacterium]
MVIDNLRINGYGKLKDTDIHLDKGINIIYGRNESGKSTITSFIKSMLYGIDKNKSGNEYSELEKYKPWDNGAFSGSIEYTINDDKYVATREFKNNSTKVFKNDGEDISSSFEKDKSRGIDIGFEQLKIDEDTFENTVFIKQDSIDVDEVSQSNILQKLSNIIQSGDEDVSYEKINNRLNKKLYDEVGTDRTTTKPKYILSKKIAELESRESTLIKNKERHEEIVSETYRLIEEKEKAQKEIDKTKEVYSIKSKYDDEVSNQRYKHEAIQEEKKKLKKEKDHQQKRRKIVDTIIILIAAIVLATALGIYVNYYLSIGAILIGTALIFINLKLMYKEKNELEDDNFDLIQEDIRKKESKELSKLEKKGFAKSITEKKVSELKSSYSNLEEKLKKIELEIHKLTIEDKMLVDGLNELSLVHEELYEKEIALEKVKEEEIVLNLALDVLNKSYDELRKRVIPELEKDVSFEIAKATNNTYNKVMFNSKDGIITFNSFGEPIKVNLLSKGTIDEIYLGFRLAISDRYNGVPMVFDEAFAYFDNERLKNVLITLKEICDSRQVIILTCSEREIKILEDLNINFNKITL